MAGVEWPPHSILSNSPLRWKRGGKRNVLVQLAALEELSCVSPTSLEITGPLRTSACLSLATGGREEDGRGCRMERRVKLCRWFHQGVTVGETPVGRSVLTVGGGSRGGGKERPSWADLALGLGLGLGRLGPGGKKREGREQLGRSRSWTTSVVGSDRERERSK
jgi:hypothetical protein